MLGQSVTFMQLGSRLHVYEHSLHHKQGLQAVQKVCRHTRCDHAVSSKQCTSQAQANKAPIMLVTGNMRRCSATLDSVMASSMASICLGNCGTNTCSRVCIWLSASASSWKHFSTRAPSCSQKWALSCFKPCRHDFTSNHSKGVS